MRRENEDTVFDENQRDVCARSSLFSDTDTEKFDADDGRWLRRLLKSVSENHFRPQRVLGRASWMRNLSDVVQVCLRRCDRDILPLGEEHDSWFGEIGTAKCTLSEHKNARDKTARHIHFMEINGRNCMSNVSLRSSWPRVFAFRHPTFPNPELQCHAML